MCRMRRLKGCSDGSGSTAWDYAGLLCNLNSLDLRDHDAGPKCCHYSQTSRAQSPLNHFYSWYNMLLTQSHSTPPPLKFFNTPLTSSLFFPSLRPRDIESIIIIIMIAYCTQCLINKYGIYSIVEG